MAILAALARFARRSAATLAGLVLLAGPATAQPAVWVVKDADSTIYLLGTITMLKPETQWRTPKLDAAMAEASELWLESPTTDPKANQSEMTALVARHGLAPASPLSKDLTPEEMSTLDEAARLSGLTATQLDAFRPWFAALTIRSAAMTRAGYEPGSGADAAIEAIFRERGIAPKGLETPGEQIAVFSGMSRQQELEYLRQTMEEYQGAAVELDTMVAQWLSADLAGLEQLANTEMKQDQPDLYAALLVNRNVNWVAKIEEMLKGAGTIFVAVTAGHLVGPDSVIAMLDSKGVKAERVQ